VPEEEVGQVPATATFWRSELSTRTACRPTGTPSSEREASLPSGKYDQLIARHWSWFVVQLGELPPLATLRLICCPSGL
jgi:hypothetical protein